MSNGTLIAGIVFLILCCVPILLINKRKQARHKRFMKELEDFARENNCSVSESESLNEIAIGIDKTKRHVFFIRKTQGYEVHKHTGLDEFKKCKLNTISRLVGSGDQTIIEKLELVLVHQASSQNEKAIELYNVEYDNLTMTGELQLAEKWERIINENIPVREASQPSPPKGKGTSKKG